MSERSPFLPENAEAAKKGLIKQLARNGGTCPIGDLHTFSTQRFAAGHQAFSALMEWLVDDEIVMYDGNAFHLTEKGLALSKSMLL
jgi:hypothetical protein